MDLVTEQVRIVMARLEAQDAQDRVDGTPQAQRLRAITPETGQFLLTLALAIRARTIVEVGTSGGYSGLWLALAARESGGRLTTFDVDPAKVALARAAFADAGLAEVVESRNEDGVAALGTFGGTVDLVFLDAEKDLYEAALEPAIGALRPGGLLVADNLTTHPEELGRFRDRALSDERLVGLVVPIGKGELVAVRR
ncbi:MAG TPA: class I SAM-dependent methyltransferase [Candidatus Deferrimicrobiaceae bacterium]|nr:class I SAM-dependent methyltransferase [Candidatus Deferrimicrobiaceae bacterium]